ncbi:hypothetical protein HPB52_023318 [Rhipicephalus sanguineus]|uniref:HAT C-terminal dimerisation domain-containing protein n=1 Tax=Rhipicephalus sanguineus TaxID=34632 RepID=A0A9D4QCN2_RHISA|nr:hypothetical protein HPB52_023318 [Rhipicephalus sanguineus]
MALPRITGRQMQRSNVPSATPEEYYRRNVYLPLLADFENQLRDRFDAHKKALEMCNRDFFPNIHSLLSILATLPVSTSTPERTFSTLRRLKSYLRNHMNNDRLTGLALLCSIHRELQVTPEQVLTEFCKLPRRKNFLV